MKTSQTFCDNCKTEIKVSFAPVLRFSATLQDGRLCTFELKMCSAGLDICEACMVKAMKELVSKREAS